MLDFATPEQAVIGCLLIDERCVPIVRQILPCPAVFSLEKCARAYEAVCALADAGRVIDAVTVARMAGLENDFLARCMDITPSCSGVSEYAQTVLEGHRRRKLRQIGDELLSGASARDAQPEQVLTQARAALDALAERDMTRTVKSPADSLKDFLLFRHEVNEGKRQCLKVGFPSLDSILGGFAPGGLYIAAARPGVGKSALGIAMADMMAKDRRVLYVSLEMTEEELNARRLAAFSTASSSYGKLLFGKTTQAEDDALYHACGILHQRKLMIAAVPSMTVAELGVQARNVRAEVIVLDYLGLLTGAGRNMSEYERITQISGDLKRLAKGLNCVILALCQLNREAASVDDTRPRLSQLRSSGAIEQDADGVLLLHRPDYGKPERKHSPAAPEDFYVDVAKNRHGRTGTVKLHWYAPVNRFEDRSDKWTVKSWT